MQDIVQVSRDQESATYLTAQNIERIKAMFKDEQSYQYYMKVLWLLRELTEAKCQRKDEAGHLYVDIQDRAFPILETTNELIGCLLRDGDCFALNANL